MDLRPLLYFVTVARLGNFTRAGEELHVTQPTISKMIKNLEQELGVVLLDRSTKQVRLTDAGEAVLAQAQQIVDSLEALPAQLADLMHLRRGNLRVGLPPMVGAHFFPEVIAQFHERYPQVTLRLIEQGARRLEQAITSGDLDLAATVLPTDEEQFQTFRFAKEPLQVVMARENPLARREALRLIDLREEPLILYREDFALHGIIRQECQRLGFLPQVVCESSQWDFLAEMAAARIGVALLPQTICRQLDQQRLTMIPLIDPPIYWDLALIWRRDGYLSFAAREWLEMARQRFAAR